MVSAAPRFTSRTLHSTSSTRCAPSAVAIAIAAALGLGGCASFTLPALPQFEIPDNDPSFRGRVYAGAAFGTARLHPQTDGTNFNVGQDTSTATQLRLGVDIHNMLAVEIESSVLGAAELHESGRDVAYSAASVNALVYGLGGVQMRSRRLGWSAYGRVGFGSLSRSSEVLPLDGSSTGAVFGLGAEYGFDGGLGIRGEITRYDSEAVFAGLGAIYRFGVTPRDVGQMVASIVNPVLDQEPTRVGTSGRSVAAAPAGRDAEPSLGAALPARQGPDRVRSRVSSGDRDGDGVADASDACPDSSLRTTVANDGCGLFDAVLGDVVFKSGSFWLNARARGALDEVADKLLAFPEVRIDVQAHTDAKGDADRNLALAARRAESAVQYLRSRGISEMQLESRGLGESRPLASNDSEAGRRRNRRIELVTLDNLSDAVLAGREIEGSVWHYPLVREAQDVLSAQASSDWLTSGAKRRSTAPVVASGEAVAEEAKMVANAGAQSAPTAGIESTQAPPALAAARAVPLERSARPGLLPAPGLFSGLRIGGVVAGVGFASGSDELTDESDRAIRRLHDDLERNPGTRVAVMAHTDSAGDPQENLQLSQARARRVIAELVHSGIDPARLEAEGYGETLPLVQNVTEADRARNRRIEIRVLR